MGLHRPLPGARGSRHLNRLRLGVPAKLVLTHETRDCLIDDISASGARLRIKRAVPAGQTVKLAFHELALFAAVKWSVSGECGLQFDAPLDPEDMRGMLWITENRELYARICDNSAAIDWASGRGD